MPSANVEARSMNRRGALALAGGVCAAAMTKLRADDAAAGAAGDKPVEKVIDCHLHINHSDRSIDDTLRHMDATGTDRAFILPLETGEGGVTLKAETVLHAWYLHPERLIPFCQTDIRRNDFVDRLHAYHRLGSRGVGEQKEHVPLKDPRIEALIATCDEFNWPLTLHFQDGVKGFNQGLATDLEPYLKKYKNVRIIGHAQTWWANLSGDPPPAEETLYPKGPIKPGGLLDRLLGEYPNLYADLSAGSGYNALTRDEEFTAGFFERHPRQILFGSDCPCRDGRGENFNGVCFSTQLRALIERLVTNLERRADIYRNNALRALDGKT